MHSRRSLARLLAVLLALALFAAACSPRPAGEPTPVATAAATPSAAATREPAPPLPPIVAETLGRVAEIRRLTAPDSVRLSIIKRDEIAPLLDRLITDHDREVLARVTTLYRLLGHFSEDQDWLGLFRTFGTTSVLGLYSPADDELWVVSDSGAAGLEDLSRGERETLAHELLHAIQDHHFELDSRSRSIEENLDRSLAYSAVIEGDATVHEGIYSDRYLSISAAGIRFLLADSALASAEIPQSFIRELLFPYTTGATWVRSLLDGGGTGAIDAYLDTPPAASSIILHPDEFGPSFRPQEVALPGLGDALGAGWREESRGTLGEFHLRNYLQLRLRSTEASAAAEGWRGDSYAVFVNGTDSAAAFRVAFASAAEAAEFGAAHAQLLDSTARGRSTRGGGVAIYELGPRRFGAVVDVSGSEVIFALATTEPAARALAAALAGG